MSHVPFLAKAESTMRVLRLAAWNDLMRSRAGYARHDDPASRLIVLLADIEMQRRRDRGDLTSDVWRDHESGDLASAARLAER